MINLKYINHLNEELDLSDWPFVIQPENLFDYTWSYNATETNRRGGKISNIYRNVTEISLDIAIHADTEADFMEAMERFFSIVEKDVLANTPGQLVLDDDQYLTGYILASQNQHWSEGIRTNIKGVKFVSEYPFWCRDNIFEFSGASGGHDIQYGFLDYPYDYAYDYYPTDIAAILDNSSLGELDFEIRVNGPATDPSISIGYNTYQVDTTLVTGDTLVINSKEKSIINYHADGTRDNLINDRTEGIFNKIPPGKLSIVKNVSAFTIVLFEERSEPEWISY